MNTKIATVIIIAIAISIYADEPGGGGLTSYGHILTGEVFFREISDERISKWSPMKPSILPEAELIKRGMVIAGEKFKGQEDLEIDLKGLYWFKSTKDIWVLTVLYEAIPKTGEFRKPMRVELCFLPDGTQGLIR